MLYVYVHFFGINMVKNSKFNQIMLGSKHCQVYLKSVPVYQIHSCFGQRPKVVAKCCLNWSFFNGALYCCVSTEI